MGPRPRLVPNPFPRNQDDTTSAQARNPGRIVGTFRITSGGVTVKVDDGAAAAVERVINNIAGDIVRPMQQMAQKVRAKAQVRWPDQGRRKSPRATGKSRRAFDVQTSVDLNPDTGAGTIRVRLVNNARSETGFYYAGAIQSLTAGQGTVTERFNAEVDGSAKEFKTRLKTKARKPWTVFVTNPMRKQSRDLAIEIGDAVARLMRGN